MRSSTGLNTYRRCRRLAVLALVALTIAGAAGAQEPAPTPPEETDPFGTPRATMRGFLEAARANEYERAAKHLNLGRIPTSRRKTEGPELARQLKFVLDRRLWVELRSLSDAPEGDREDGLPAHRDAVGTIKTAKEPVTVHVEQTRRGERPTWKVAADTVAAIPDLYAEFGYGPLGEWLPPVFFELQVLDVQLWQWIALLVLAAVALPLSWVAVWLIVLLTRPLVRRTRHLGDDWTREVAEQPLRLILAVSIFTGPAYLIGLSIPAQRFFAAVEKATIVIGIAWLIARAIDLGARMLTRQLGANGRAPAVSFVPLGQRALKGLLAGLALLAVLQNFGVNVTGILAGLGIGGLAVALAAQKTVENLFGGVMLFFDQPVRVGDFCRFGSQLGTVEYIGMRSTQVRTLDRTVVSVPNAEFAQMQLENFGKRDRIRFIHTIGLRYETTPDQLRHVLVELKRLLARHPKIDPDPARPRFVSFGAHSLDIEVFAYVLTSDINEYLAIQEDLLLRIMELVAASGTGFAFPSQTIYTAADTGLDGDRTRTAEERVHKWREENALPLPTFPPAELVKIARTLDYPAKGSATAQR